MLSKKVEAFIPLWESGFAEKKVVSSGGTAAVAALVTFSPMPASSMNETRTLMVLPTSAERTGYVGPVEPACPPWRRPLVAETGVARIVGVVVGDARGGSSHGFVYLDRAGDGGHSGDRAVLLLIVVILLLAVVLLLAGLLGHRSHRIAGHTLGVADEGYPDRLGLAPVVGRQGVGGVALPQDVAGGVAATQHPRVSEGPFRFVLVGDAGG